MEKVEPKVVGLDIFDTVEKIKLSDSVKYDFDYTLELYKEYLLSLKYLEGKTELTEKEINAFLNSMKKADIKANQVTEGENEDLIDIYRELSRDSVIDKLIRKNGEPISIKELKSYHHFLLKGTSSDDGEIDHTRKNNNTFVGTYNADRTKNIQYMPIDYKDINEALTLLCEYYNYDTISEERDVLLRPFLFHALVACLQIFTDGNTRLARVLQHAKIWNYTNEYNYLLLTEEDSLRLSKPALYLTVPYKLYRGQYREIIKELVTENTNNIWNQWLTFNLYRTQEELNKQTDTLNAFKREIKRHRY